MCSLRKKIIEGIVYKTVDSKLEEGASEEDITFQQEQKDAFILISNNNKQIELRK